MHGLGVRDGKDVDHSLDHCEYTKEIWQSILGLTSGKDKWNEDSLLECMKNALMRKPSSSIEPYH